MSETPECPVCGEVGVKACVDEEGHELSHDHEGRPPYFDASASAVLDGMARVTPPSETAGGVGTGAGEVAPRQDTGSARVTRSADCPEAPAQAHPLGTRVTPPGEGRA